MARDIEKHKKAKREWYLRNKELTNSRSRRDREIRKEKIRKIKESSPCTDCNIFYPYWVMHFDHLGNDEKIDTINNLLVTVSMEKVLDEIKKCELVCANCHATRTWKRLHDIDV